MILTLWKLEYVTKQQSLIQLIGVIGGFPKNTKTLRT